MMKVGAGAVVEQRAKWLVTLMVVLKIGTCQVLVATCSSVEGNEYCQCKQKEADHTGRTITIKCDFKYKEDVLLNKELYPFRNSSLVSAYVRVVNATSVNVTGEFLKEWLQAPSAALDIWRGGNVTLESVPQLDNLDTFSIYRTFVGVGIVNCYIPEIPRMFLRDRTRGGFRIKASRVGTLRAGLLHNIDQMRYLVLEDSVVELVEGSVSTEGYVTLSQRNVHSWSGLIISNTTINTIAPAAFNLTHQSDMESVEIINCQLGSVGKEALSVVGDIDVTIKGNYFSHLQTQSFKVAVTGVVKFDENIIGEWEMDALEGIMCHNRTSLEKNVVHVNNPGDLVLNNSIMPFHTSCGNPQMFLVVNPAHTVQQKISMKSTWVMVALVSVLVVVLALVHVLYTRSGVTRYYGVGRFPLILNGRKCSQETLPTSADLSPPTDPTQEGKSNPVYSPNQSNLTVESLSCNMGEN
ncbi:uncharacterized protein [Panulirus ornatus]|uniref:uncharacterized protein n=1 Tax=Panulirus ornatus TaxID=150431 RepID=UPI003A8C358B